MNPEPTGRLPFPRPLDLRTGRVEMAHGSGGRAMSQLVHDLFAARFDNPSLARGHDAAVLEVGGSRIAVSTDGFVIRPPFFPGGDIGRLAVHGTINDVAMAGARPLSLTAAVILEEGFPLVDLERIVASMAEASREAGVPIVTGDTKVVERGKGDGVFITTTGIGLVPEGVDTAGDRARPGDRVLLSGTIGDHGMAVMSVREGLEFETRLRSDTAALHTLVADLVAAAPGLRVLRDPTRGGLASTLNEIAWQSGVGILLREAAIPVRSEVRAASEILGLDPLYVANEGKLIAIAAAGDADRLLATLRRHPLGRESAIIGEVVEDSHRFVRMATAFGGERIVDWMSGEPLPRIC